VVCKIDCLSAIPSFGRWLKNFHHLQSDMLFWPDKETRMSDERMYKQKDKQFEILTSVTSFLAFNSSESDVE
jgi:hypothetical protein